MKNNNPFFVQEYFADAPFCGRQESLKKLTGYGRSLEPVVLFSPRHTGKTTVIKKVQKTLSQEGAICFYADLFGVASVEDLAARLVQAVFAETFSRETLFKRATRAITAFRPTGAYTVQDVQGVHIGIERVATQLSGLALLKDVLKSLGKFIRESVELVHFALDEFQEITTLPRSLQLESILRAYFHRHAAAYVFLGSRRGVLCAMFTEQECPFYKAAALVPLPLLPENELTVLVREQFTDHGKACSPEIAQHLVAAVEGFPYYVRKLASIVFEYTDDEVTAQDVEKSFHLLLLDEQPRFEGILLGFAPGQIALLQALAKEPSKSIFAQDFIERHRLGSIGGAQGAKKRMLQFDIIEFRNQKWQIVDPVFAMWLNRSRHYLC